MVRHSPLKAQSAMEYLLTYGWAILVISIVLASLVALNVFSGIASISTACIPAAGFGCTNPVLLTTGALTVTVSQSTGVTAYNAIFTVASTGSSLNSVGFPTQGVVTSNVPGTGLYSGASNVVAVTLTTTQVPSGLSLSGVFTGVIWMNYSTTSVTSAASSAVKIATLNVHVT